MTSIAIRRRAALDIKNNSVKMYIANRQQRTKKIQDGKDEKETCIGEKRVSPWGNDWERGIIMLLVCAVLNNSERVVGTVVCGNTYLQLQL